MDNAYKFDNTFDRNNMLPYIVEYLEGSEAGYEIKAFKSCILITVTYVDTYEHRKDVDELLRSYKPVKTWKAPYQRKKEGDK